MKMLIIILLILISVVFLIAISTGAFIGTGYVLSLILPLNLFQASLLCIGATFVFAFIISAIVIGNALLKADADGDEYEDIDLEDDGDLEEVDEELDDALNKKFANSKLNKISRNAPCPCGSGKKYKNCCGK